MAFDDKEVQKMCDIFKHIQPETLTSIQEINHDYKYRVNATFGVKDKKKKYIYIYQYFKNLSSTRRKILDRRKKEVPYQINIIEVEKDIICVGWKFEETKKTK